MTISKAASLLRDMRGYDGKVQLSEADVNRLLKCKAGDLGRPLLVKGNDKLSRHILTFGLPAVMTCPGRSELCGGEHALCYATHYHYKQANVVRPRLENYVLASRRDFSDLVLSALDSTPQRVVRPHDSGDFFSAEYAEAWLAVFRKARRHRHFLFSRSWRVPGVAPVLAAMSRLHNVRVWYSVDRETGWPDRLPARARVAYMQADAGDEPSGAADLVFRDYAARSAPAKRVAGALVCPYENGMTRVAAGAAKEFDCHRCGLCWGELDGPRDPRRHAEPRERSRSTSLPVLRAG